MYKSTASCSCSLVMEVTQVIQIQKRDDPAVCMLQGRAVIRLSGQVHKVVHIVVHNSLFTSLFRSAVLETFRQAGAHDCLSHLHI